MVLCAGYFCGKCQDQVEPKFPSWQTWFSYSDKAKQGTTLTILLDQQSLRDCFEKWVHSRHYLLITLCNESGNVWFKFDSWHVCVRLDQTWRWKYKRYCFAGCGDALWDMQSFAGVRSAEGGGIGFYATVAEMGWNVRWAIPHAEVPPLREVYLYSRAPCKRARSGHGRV